MSTADRAPTVPDTVTVSLSGPWLLALATIADSVSTVLALASIETAAESKRIAQAFIAEFGLAGGLAAMSVLTVVAVAGVAEVAHRLTTRATAVAGVRIGLGIVRLLLLRGLLRATKILGALVLVIFGGGLIVDGHLLAAVETLVGAGPLGWAARGALPFVAAALVRLAAPTAGDDFVRATQRLLRSAGVRAWWAVLGAPILTTTLTAPVVAVFSESLPLAIGLALAVGKIVRLPGRVCVRVSYKLADAGGDRQVNEVRAASKTVTDADGEVLYVLTVDGHELAHRDPTALVESARRVVDWRLFGSRGPQAPRYPTTVEHHYYRRAVEEGRVDLDDARRALRGGIETAVRAHLQQGGGEIDRSELVDELGRWYPLDEIERALAFLERTGNVGVRANRVVSR